MEKRNPTYNLKDIQATFQKIADLRMSRIAGQTRVRLGFSLEDVVFVIQSLGYQNFYKSMTTYTNHRVWQDVYHFKFNQIDLYIKFMMDDEGYLIISFKER